MASRSNVAEEKTPQFGSWMRPLIFLVGLFISKYVQNRSLSDHFLKLNSEQISHHLQNHTFVHIVGQHLSGTTLVWQALKTNANISTFQLRTARQKARFSWAEGLDFQGIFMQNVLPKFGLDQSNYFHFKLNLVGSYGDYIPSFWLLPHKGKRYHHGMGSFALNERNHLTETWGNARKLADSLFVQWGAFWDLSKPMLLERSPSNAITTRLLNAIWNSADSGSHNTKFIFLTRHPLMYALAMEKFSNGSSILSTYEAVEQWIAIQETFLSDCEHLPDDSYRIIQLEDLAKNPDLIMTPIFSWLGLEQDFESEEWDDWLLDVESHPNQNYRVEYQQRLQIGGFQEDHRKMIEDFQPKLSSISDYDLNEFNT